MLNKKCPGQTLVNWGPDSTIVNEANSTRSSPKPRQSPVIKLMDRTWVTRPQGESRVKSTLTIGHFEFLGNYYSCFTLFLNSDIHWSNSPKFGPGLKFPNSRSTFCLLEELFIGKCQLKNGKNKIADFQKWWISPSLDFLLARH